MLFRSVSQSRYFAHMSIATAMDISDDGMYLFIAAALSLGGDQVQQINLSNSFNLTSGSYSGQFLPISGIEGNVRSIRFV